MDGDPLGRLSIARKSGDEQFHANGQPLGFDVLSFWRWGASDLVGNTLRGVLAEYLVACDLGVTDGTRLEWNAYDLLTPLGLKVEVKSAAYIQTWSQVKLSAVRFDIRTTNGWDATTNQSSTDRKRQADVYVFALLNHKDKATVDPLNVDQWEFYILPTATLNAHLPHQKQISLGTLLRLNPMKARFGEIAGVLASIRAK